jgi:YebC/PmpR family DNA-binding regulatory protein
MSGHNKWSKIKHKKAATDAKKSKVFGKLARLIASESKRAKGDTSAPSLRAAIEKARAENMPSENIDRAVAKGNADTAQALEEVRYETYGPGGVAIIIDGLTDNRNRTAAEIKHLLTKHSYELAAPGSASWAFESTENGWVPKTMLDLNDNDLEKLSVLVEALEEHDDVQSVYTNAD